MRIMVLGLGNFGRSWAVNVVPSVKEAVLCAVVDQDASRFAGIEAPCYTDWREAVEKAKPELVINVTPPNVHVPLTKELLQAGCAVLCEKPIASTARDAIDLARFSSQGHYRVSIAENYRYHAGLRMARDTIASGSLGRLHSLSCRFSHYHPDFSMFYHGSLSHPLMMDVAVHHMDVARYLTGKTPVSVSAAEWDAPYSWYGKRKASAHVLAEFDDGLRFLYEGTLAAPVSTTDWYGDWYMECDGGILTLAQGILRLFKKEGVAPEILIQQPEGDTRIPLLQSVIAAFSKGILCESDIQDNLHSFLLATGAIKAAETGKKINLRELYDI